MLKNLCIFAAETDTEVRNQKHISALRFTTSGQDVPKTCEGTLSPRTAIATSNARCWHVVTYAKISSRSSSDEGNACGFSDSKAQRERFAEHYDFSATNATVRDKETGFGYFGARYMDHELMTMWLSVDPMSDKYPSLSPYNYCAWNPVNYIDPNGDSIAVLLARNAVYGEGHLAILVQNYDGRWTLWSKNGEGKSASEAKSASDNDKPYKKAFRSIQDFLDDCDANSEGHNGSKEPYYTEAYMIPSTKEQDKIIQKTMSTFMNDYHLLSDNCADAVKKSLNAAGIATEIDILQGQSNTAKAIMLSSPRFLLTKHMIEDVIPVTIYRNIKDANPKGTIYKPCRRK